MKSTKRKASAHDLHSKMAKDNNDAPTPPQFCSEDNISNGKDYNVMLYRSPKTAARDVIFGSFTCLRLCFYGFAFVELVHRSDFRGGSKYPGFELCYLVLRARLHCL